MTDHPPPDVTVRKSLTLPASMWRDIEAYRAAERIVSEAEAVRRVIQSGLKRAPARH